MAPIPCAARRSNGEQARPLTQDMALRIEWDLHNGPRPLLGRATSFPSRSAPCFQSIPRSPPTEHVTGKLLPFRVCFRPGCLAGRVFGLVRRGSCMLDTGNQVAQIAARAGSGRCTGRGRGRGSSRCATGATSRGVRSTSRGWSWGGAPESQIHLDNASVSRQHAELTRDPFGRWWVRDLASRNGTFVNGQRVTERVIAAGDIVQVGACSLVLQSSPTRRVGVHRAGRGMRSGVFAPEADVSTISTLRDMQPPRIAASHLNDADAA